ncbi:MAG: M48 family metalloprotease [Gammaproteobacteria bacterium]|nr:M48 family metalloprotease [Gammaproteobacteria bacterium]MCY4255380.1 M48 family metalloprotease [Gammaproteobacteria bacterium]MCY4340556.1 M48 family metalloprotease [Gammaproteobacteria bacterium]
MSDRPRSRASRAQRAACAALALLLSAHALPAGGQAGQGQDLPDMGSLADSVLTGAEEREIALSVMEQIRRAGKLVADPEINEYISDVGKRLAYRAQNGDHQFHFFVVQDPSINAFALPGGYIGVHTGLIEATANESELAGVLAHEIAHVTQRHISRQIQAMRGNGIMSMAMLAGALLVGGLLGGGGEMMQGALMASQGMALQQRINFTRAHEHEADRIGIGTLAEAGFDPRGLPSFFETMSRKESLASAAIPEILRTHPVSVNRIAEARSRITPQMMREADSSLNYYLAQAQAQLLDSENPELALRRFRSRPLTETPGDIGKFYGEGLALLEAGRPAEAREVLRTLRKKHPNSIPLRIAEARATASAGNAAAARRAFEDALRLFPGNVSIAHRYAEALIADGQAPKARELLLEYLINDKLNLETTRLLAQASGESGQVADAHYFMAEYELMRRNLNGAHTQLRLALTAAEQSDEVRRSRIEARLEQVELMGERGDRRKQQEDRDEEESPG